MKDGGGSTFMDQKAEKAKQPAPNIFEMVKDATPRDPKTEIVWLKDYEEEAMEYLKNAHKYLGVSTGYNNVDTLLGSFLPGELLTVGGDTGHGKSLFAMNIAQNVYEKTGMPVLMVNLELTREQAIQRFYNLSGKDHDYAGILVQAAPAVQYKDIDGLMKRAKEEGAALVIIDHLHFFSRASENQPSELSRIMKHFKECAVENKLAVILLSHVTPTRIMTNDGQAKSQRPGLHNFKGSSSIEQDSDMVGFVFRDDKTPKEVEFYLRKNRSRPLDPEPITLTQKEWKLTEDPEWLPKNLPPSGV
jgi:replicative DNA helicase